MIRRILKWWFRWNIDGLELELGPYQEVGTGCNPYGAIDVDVLSQQFALERWRKRLKDIS